MEENNQEKKEFKGYAATRIGVGILLMLAALWIFGTLLRFVDEPAPVEVARVDSHEQTPKPHDAEEKKDHHPPIPEEHKPSQKDPDAIEKASHEPGKSISHSAEAASPTPPHPGVHTPPVISSGHGAGEKKSADLHGESHQLKTEVDAHASGGHGIYSTETAEGDPKGVAFINAVIRPLEYELTERFWRWRPNDILDFTDNVNNFQLGVLEVTRRTAVILAERLSRTGTTASFDKNLENAMNWFMIKADRYWFPSPESKYKAGLKELSVYREKLRQGEAHFYTRTDNLIPLLMAYEDLLGSCDENLVKEKEDDGSTVSHFSSDDYFFYARGVASAMYTILVAVEKDFHTIIESRRGSEVLHHAIESCHHAMEIKPIYITNSNPSGIFANHRANMAAPISHARFYIGLLIKTLST